MKNKEILIILLIVFYIGIFFARDKFTFSTMDIFTWALVLAAPFIANKILQKIFGGRIANWSKTFFFLLLFVVVCFGVIALFYSLFVSSEKLLSKELLLELGLTPIKISWGEKQILTRDEIARFCGDLEWEKDEIEWNGRFYFVTNIKADPRGGDWGGLHGTWLSRDDEKIYESKLYLVYPALIPCEEKLCLFGLENQHFVSKKWWYKIPVFGDMWWQLNPAVHPTGFEKELVVLTFPGQKGYLINNPCPKREIYGFKKIEGENGIQVEILCREPQLYRAIFNIAELGE